MWHWNFFYTAQFVRCHHGTHSILLYNSTKCDRSSFECSSIEWVEGRVRGRVFFSGDAHVRIPSDWGVFVFWWSCLNRVRQLYSNMYGSCLIVALELIRSFLRDATMERRRNVYQICLMGGPNGTYSYPQLQRNRQ